MNSEKIQDILHAISALTVIEACDLVKAMREHFDLPVMTQSVNVVTTPEAAIEEQTEFSVVITEIGTKKIDVIKCLRQATQLGLKEAKDCIDSVGPNSPYTIATDLDKEAAQSLKALFNESGATVILK